MRHRQRARNRRSPGGSAYGQEEQFNRSAPDIAGNERWGAVVSPCVPISVVLVDDHPIVLQGLQHLFERQPDFTVASTCASAETALDAVRAQRPDVLVLDLRMPG